MRCGASAFAVCGEFQDIVRSGGILLEAVRKVLPDLKSQPKGYEGLRQACFMVDQDSQDFDST